MEENNKIVTEKTEHTINTHVCQTCGEDRVCRPVGDSWECAECSARRFLGGWD